LVLKGIFSRIALHIRPKCLIPLHFFIRFTLTGRTEMR
jgi:hypothetical protein